MKRITVNVDIFFAVPDDYEVTDMETLDFPAQPVLMNHVGNEVEGARKTGHCTMLTVEKEN